MTLDKVLKNILLVEWEESERDWGTRPDGYSLHLTSTDADKYIKNYWDNMPDETPDEYSRPIGSKLVLVSGNLYSHIEKREYGLRIFDISNYVKSGDLKID